MTIKMNKNWTIKESFSIISVFMSFSMALFFVPITKIGSISIDINAICVAYFCMIAIIFSSKIFATNIILVVFPWIGLFIGLVIKYAIVGHQTILIVSMMNLIFFLFVIGLAYQINEWSKTKSGQKKFRFFLIFFSFSIIGFPLLVSSPFYFFDFLEAIFDINPKQAIIAARYLYSPDLRAEAIGVDDIVNFHNRIAQYLCACSIFIFVFSRVAYKNKRNDVFYYFHQFVSFLTMFISIILLSGQSLMVFLAIVIFVILWCFAKVSFSRLRFLFVLSGVFVGFLAFLANSKLAHLILARLNSSDKTTGRASRLVDAYDAIFSDSLLGNQMEMVEDYHNLLASTTYELGIIGLLLTLLIWIVLTINIIVIASKSLGLGIEYFVSCGGLLGFLLITLISGGHGFPGLGGIILLTPFFYIVLNSRSKMQIREFNTY